MQISNEKKVIIGVIDTGVDVYHKRFNEAQIDGHEFYEDSNGAIYSNLEINDTVGHGTGITSIILSHLDVSFCRIYVVKLNSEEKIVTERLLAKAINYLNFNIHANIINISMGIKTNYPSDELEEACIQAYEQGVVIVASSHYLNNERCYPAHFTTVYGVGQGIIKDKQKFKLLNKKWANILAKGGFQRVAIPNNGFKFGTGTSFATAHFTGIIANSFIHNKWNSHTTLLNWLKEESDESIFSLSKHDSDIQINELNLPVGLKNKQDLSHYLKLPSETKEVAIFPFEEKEMVSLVKLKEMIVPKLALAIGYPRSIKLNDSHSWLNEIGLPYYTRHLTENEMSMFDTLVVGYLFDSKTDHNILFGYELIKSCIKRNKNFVVWDKYVYEFILKISKEQIEYSGRIFCPVVNESIFQALIANVNFSKLKTPSICVVGTKKQQGKFTTQLIIKKLLKNSGYNVAHISTEPQGCLQGADVCFPIGHNSTVDLCTDLWSEALVLLQKLIEESSNPDILISGSQGGILPIHPINDGSFSSLQKLSFVKAIYPDSIVCTISPNDSLEFIHNSIATIKSFVNTQVLFYVLTPWKFESEDVNGIFSMRLKKVGDEEYQEKLLFFQQHLKLPVINIMDRENDSFILSSITAFFSSEKN